MPRAVKSRVIVEEMVPPGISWSMVRGGFKSIPEAEAWVRDNIADEKVYRVIRISGVFNAKRTVIKR